jgi:hypothetical protein
LALCRNLGASHYINPIGGMNLYANDDFEQKHISLSFLKSEYLAYPQFHEQFVPWLSIIDVLMFNEVETIKGCLGHFELLKNS